MKILLVQTSFLGDVVLSTPLIACLKKLYPDAELHALATPAGAELLEPDPFLTGIVVFDKRGKHSGIGGLRELAQMLEKMGFDRAYSLHRSLRTALLLWLARIPARIGYSESTGWWLYTSRKKRFPRGVGGEHDVIRNLRLLDGELEGEQRSSELRLFLTQETEQPDWSEEMSGSNGFIVLAPGSIWPTKRWYWEHYRRVAEHFLSRGQQVLVVGSKAEREICDRVARGLSVSNLAGKTTLSEVVRIISSAHLIVCNDSFPLHVASAFQIPTVAIFCATSPEFGFGPWKNSSRVLEVEGLSCKPCHRHGSKICPTGTERCMKGLLPSQVILAAESLLDSPPELSEQLPDDRVSGAL